MILLNSDIQTILFNARRMKPYRFKWSETVRSQIKSLKLSYKRCGARFLINGKILKKNSVLSQNRKLSKF